MDIASRKLKIIEKLVGIINPQKLEKIEDFFNTEIIDDSMKLDNLPNVAERLLHKSERDARLNNVKSHENVVAEARSKYNKRSEE